MKIFDVIQTVDHQGAKNSSLPFGSWIINCFLNPDAARGEAERANDNNRVTGISYSVEEHEELSPLRKMNRGDYHRLLRGDKVDGYSEISIARSRCEIS